MEKTPEELFKEREKRVLDAIQLKVPDRVPISAISGFFSAPYIGATFKDLMYDKDKAIEGTLWFLQEFQPDLGESPFMLTYLGPLFETVGFTRLLWPGHGLDDMSSYQFLERENMTRDEYDEYLFDPTDFVIRKVWPRIFSTLKPFENLAPLHDVVDFITNIRKFIGFAAPEVQNALESLVNTGKRSQEIFDESVLFDEKLTELGFPTIIGSLSQAPFDYISDYLRGTKGAMVDMIRVPDKVLAMIEKIFPMMLRMGLDAKQTGKPGVFIPLHKCLDNFMSPDQFKTFFWPSLKRLIVSLIEEDLIPMVLWEGDCGSRLETIRDIPPKKAVYYFERTDMFRAKEVLGDVVCLQGNVPLSLLVGGTPDEVKDYCKKLIDVVGKGGGFIMSPSTVLDNARLENVKAMFDTTKEYGVYG